MPIVVAGVPGVISILIRSLSVLKTELMPFARGVSGKTVDFDAQGNCIETDYYKMLPIIKAAGYTGHIGIEYEGDILSEEAGISATKALLEKVGAAI